MEPIIQESEKHRGKIKTDQEAEADRIENLIRKNGNIPETEKEALIKARIGQGKFRSDVLNIHNKCPFTRISNPIFLKTAHIKPWAKCDNNQERLDPLNGIPLSPTADLLFEKGILLFKK